MRKKLILMVIYYVKIMNSSSWNLSVWTWITLLSNNFNILAASFVTSTYFGTSFQYVVSVSKIEPTQYWYRFIPHIGLIIEVLL